MRDPAVHADVLQSFLALADSLHFTVRNLTFSPVKGPEGNIEYLLHLQNTEASAKTEEQAVFDIDAVVEEAHRTLNG